MNEATYCSTAVREGFYRQTYRCTPAYYEVTMKVNITMERASSRLGCDVIPDSHRNSSVV